MNLVEYVANYKIPDDGSVFIIRVDSELRPFGFLPARKKHKGKFYVCEKHIVYGPGTRMERYCVYGQEVYFMPNKVHVCQPSEVRKKPENWDLYTKGKNRYRTLAAALFIHSGP